MSKPSTIEKAYERVQSLVGLPHILFSQAVGKVKNPSLVVDTDYGNLLRVGSHQKFRSRDSQMNGKS